MVVRVFILKGVDVSKEKEWIDAILVVDADRLDRGLLSKLNEIYENREKCRAVDEILKELRRRNIRILLTAVLGLEECTKNKDKVEFIIAEA